MKTLMKKVSRSTFELRGRLTRELYKTIRRRIIESTETPEKRNERLQKVERSKRDGLLYAPKTSYRIYVVMDNRPPDELKRRFSFIAQRLIKIGAEHTKVYYYGLKKLAKPLKKRYEACFISFEVTVYPSLIDHIRTNLLHEPHVLRVLVLRDKDKDKERRIYRQFGLHSAEGPLGQ
ncbi:hypothetical protein BgAZ_502960 [Babesia gibsoni]|uniref:Ribosomal protein S6 n=1 Tax=Babesia gibsoni TaxID=33632 RepID=A0AAD8PCX3_BABGI|nr:hypothetical protein BgAZ_502960 [Babesia gibsoni]